MFLSRLWRGFWKSFKPRPEEEDLDLESVLRSPSFWKAPWNEVTNRQILYFLPILNEVKITLENI